MLWLLFYGQRNPTQLYAQAYRFVWWSRLLPPSFMPGLTASADRREFYRKYHWEFMYFWVPLGKAYNLIRLIPQLLPFLHFFYAGESCLRSSRQFKGHEEDKVQYFPLVEALSGLYEVWETDTQATPIPFRRNWVALQMDRWGLTNLLLLFQRLVQAVLRLAMFAVSIIC